MNVFKKDWEEWIDLNLSKGNCKVQMFKILLKEGYDYNLIKNKLDIDYLIEDTNQTELRNQIALRNAVKLNAKNLEIYEIENFLTKEECSKIISLINNSKLNDSSTISSSDKINYVVNDFRTSKTCYFNNNKENDNILMKEIESRICKSIGINNRFSEPIQGQKYTIGQEFKLHTDYFDPAVLESNKTIIGQRTWTFMIYLNDHDDSGLEGGYTSFPYAHISKKPQTGSALIWHNLNSIDKKENVFSSHCGLPIIKGDKYVLTKWFKNQEINLIIPNEISEHHFLPIFHKIGFEKVKLQLDCIDKIKAWMNENETKFIKEDLINEADKNMISNLLDINQAPKELLAELIKEMNIRLTKWIDYKTFLKHTATYGIREYKQGSSLKNHYDKKDSHIISAIIHLEEDKPWNLYIEDHNFKAHNITMEYGDVVFYESTTCLHGRPTTFEGTSYKNMYIHFTTF